MKISYDRKSYYDSKTVIAIPGTINMVVSARVQRENLVIALPEKEIIYREIT